MKEWWKSYFQILRGQIVRTPEEVQPIHDWFRAITKWWLDLVRNVIITAGLVSLAAKSDSTVLQLFSAVTLGALVCFTLVETNSYEFKLADGVLSPAWTKAFSRVLTLLITLCLTYWVVRAFLAIMSALPSLSR